MTTFSYSTGDPTNLTGGAAASMADISGPFADLKTFINGGSLDATNLATSAKPATLLGQYRTIAEACLQFEDADTAGTYSASALTGSAKSGTSAFSGAGLTFFPLTPADYAVSGLTTQFRVKGALGTNGTASAINFIGGLHAVTFSGGADTVAVTLATAVSGSTFTRSAPAINSGFVDASSDFSLSTAGVYTLGVALSGTMAANSFVIVNLRLEVRHV